MNGALGLVAVDGKLNLLERIMRYFILLVAIFILSYLKVSCESRPDIGLEYYYNINKGRIQFILKKNFDSCLYFYEKAFAINKPFANDYYQLGVFCLRMHDYSKATYYLKKACLLGMNLKAKDSSASYYYEFCSTGYIYSPFYVEYTASCDSLFREFKKGLDLKFAYLVQKIFGGDQIIRVVKNIYDYKSYDSLNYYFIRDYIEENGFPDFHTLDPETIANFNWLYHHFRLYPDSEENFKLASLRDYAFRAGMVDNLSFATAIDYYYLNTKGKQLFGSYTKMKGDSTYFEEFFFDNIDSVRAAYGLAPLLLTKIEYEKTILPSSYTYRDYYSK